MELGFEPRHSGSRLAPLIHSTMYPSCPGALGPVPLLSVSLCEYSGGERREAELHSLCPPSQKLSAYVPTAVALLQDSCLPALRSTLFRSQEAPGPGDGPRVRRPRELRICLMGCALAVAAGWLLACNHSVRHRDKEHDSREGSDREKAGEGRAGGARPWSLCFHPLSENPGRWLGDPSPCPPLHHSPRRLIPEQRTAHRPPTPCPQPSELREDST